MVNVEWAETQTRKIDPKVETFVQIIYGFTVSGTTGQFVFVSTGKLL